MADKKNNIFDIYMSGHHPDIYESDLPMDIDPESFKRFCTIANNILKDANFLLFPIEKTVTIGENEMVTTCSFNCNLIVEDKNYTKGVQTCIVKIEWPTLRNFDSLKDFLQLQIDTVYINEMSRKEKEAFCENIRLGLLAGYEILFGIKTSHNVPRLGFDTKDMNRFIFSNGILNIHTGEFTPGEYNLDKDASIKLTYPSEGIEKLSLEESLKGVLSLKNYISSDNTISATVIGFLVNGVFRNEYLEKHGEYPFLGIETYSGMGKSCLLKMISRITGFDWDSLPGTNDTDFAFEVCLDGISRRYYYLDEIQKADSKLLKFIQAAFNSGENRKGGGGGDWWKLQTFRKNCNLICTGELLPQSEEALLNRFVILNPKKDFLIKKQVTGEEELEKYETITGKKPKLNYLDMGEIRILAVNYYRPLFMNILRNKESIDYEKYHYRALELIDSVVNERGESAPDTRLRNNFAVPLTGYLMACGDGVDENEIISIITDYFTDLQDYRKSSIVSGQIVDYIIENMGRFSSWMNKVTSGKNNPKVYLKHCDRQKGLLMQLSGIAKICKKELDFDLQAKHIEQQLRAFLKSSNTKPENINVARGLFKMNAVFIPLERIKTCEPLQRLWDSALQNLGEHSKELEKVKKDNQRLTMDDTVFDKLISEINESYDTAEFFDTDSYSKENTEEIIPF